MKKYIKTGLFLYLILQMQPAFNASRMPRRMSLERGIRMLDTNDETLTALSLFLGEAGSTPINKKNLTEALKKNSFLKTFILRGGKAGHQLISSIAEALPENTSLETLDLSNVFPSVVLQIRFLDQLQADALMSSPSLKTLKLSNNEIGPNGARNLADALLTNTILETLNLSDNEIGSIYPGTTSVGINAIAVALEANRTLKTLDLGNNEIGPDDIQILADGLGENRTSITGLEKNRTLTTLNLRNNPGTTNTRAMAQIELYLTRNSRLAKLGSDYLKAFEEKIGADTKLKNINFNENFVKTRLNISTIDILDELSFKDLELLLKWAYTDIYWLLEDEEEKITEIKESLSFQPIELEEALRRMNVVEFTREITTEENKKEFVPIGISINKFVLEVRSGLFREYFANFPDENTIPETSGLSEEALRIILGFMYTDRLEFPEDSRTSLEYIKEIIRLNAIDWFQFSKKASRSFGGQLNQYIEAQGELFEKEVDEYIDQLELEKTRREEEALRREEERLMPIEDINVKEIKIIEE